MKASLIIAAYNKSDFLSKCLYALHLQTESDFEIIVADDGSNETLKYVIDEYSKLFKYPIKHIWHEDKGIRKTTILNKSVLKADSDYLIFIDHDIIPFENFVENHIKYRKKSRFISASRIELNKSITLEILSKPRIINNLIKDIGSVFANMDNKHFFRMKIKILFAFWFKGLLKYFKIKKGRCVGCNFSCWKDDFIKVGGYDTRFTLWAEDTELGYRLKNNGIYPMYKKYSILCLHLDHGKDYLNLDLKNKNELIAFETLDKKILKTEYGIK